MLRFLTFLLIICKNFPISHPDHSLNLCEIKDMLEMVLFYKNATAKENLFIFTKCCIIYKYKLNYKNKKSVTLNNLIMELKLLIEILLSNNQDINWIENYNKIIKAVVELNEALCKFIMKNQNKKDIKYSKKMIDKLNSTIIYKSENIKKYLYRKKVIKKLFLSKNIKKNEEIYLDYLAECENIPEYFDILSRKNQTKWISKKIKQENNSKEIQKEISNFYEFNTICIYN